MAYRSRQATGPVLLPTLPLMHNAVNRAPELQCLLHEEETNESHSESEREAIAKALYLHGLLVLLA